MSFQITIVAETCPGWPSHSISGDRIRKEVFETVQKEVFEKMFEKTCSKRSSKRGVRKDVRTPVLPALDLKLYSGKKLLSSRILNGYV